MRRPASVWLVMLASGAYGAAAIAGLIRDLSADLSSITWHEWIVTFYGLFVALPTCWLLWKRRPVGVWFGLLFLGIFGAFGIAVAIYRTGANMSMGSAMELLFFMFFVLALAYWFAWSKASRSFFSQQ